MRVYTQRVWGPLHRKNNNFYIEGLPHFDKIVMQIIPDSITQLLALQRGEVDYIDRVPGSELNRLNNDSSIKLSKNTAGPGGGNCIVTITYNLERDATSNLSVRKAIEEIIETCPEGIDVICNNAGVMALTDIATEDGYDIQMQTNHLSHFLLVCDLFKLLEKTAEEKGESRIVNHSSVARLTVKKLKKEYLEKNGGNLGGNGKSMMFGLSLIHI